MGPQSLPELEVLADVPANRFFVLWSYYEPEEYWDDWSLEIPAFEEDTELAARLFGGPLPPDTVRVFRLAEPEVAIGQEVRSSQCSSEGQPCGFEVGPPDYEPPSRPRIDDVHVTLYAREGGGLYGCGNVDGLSFSIDVQDDRMPTRTLLLAAYIGTDEAEARSKETPDLVWQPWWHDDYAPPLVEIALGTGGRHDRDGEHFRREGEMCFSVAAIDMAANEGERSEPVCIDTQDLEDPRVEVVGCACSTAPGSAARSLPWLVLVLASRRRRR